MIPETSHTMSSSPHPAAEPHESLCHQVVASLRGGSTPRACRLWLQRDQSRSLDQAKRIVRKAKSVLSGCDGPTTRARQLASIASDLRGGSTSSTCCASLMRETGLSRRQARRITSKVAALSGIDSTASKRSHAVADTVQRLLAGSSQKECRELLSHDRRFTPNQVRVILRNAVAGANQQELYDEYCRARACDEANEYNEKTKEFEQATAWKNAVHSLELA